ncbi:hypothetical protein NDR87_19035 [Nocardia sp. CDC159]|uniref:Uncharacterized protein n=1 Tax=Nocardia pulmonis TaxID=2951408 RepID=A0A9X2IYB3_9NOCA|nr:MULTISPECIES: hypothetical protein [Nocardia]MCM6776213.1 hypothetical protein [Nocardia pulmonis]MCM6788461.1 hypothetical protein [Nocardia sp. CDC159]
MPLIGSALCDLFNIIPSAIFSTVVPIVGSVTVPSTYLGSVALNTVLALFTGSML